MHSGHRRLAPLVQRGAAAQEPRPSNRGEVYQITDPFKDPETHSLTGPQRGTTSTRPASYDESRSTVELAHFRFLTHFLMV